MLLRTSCRRGAVVVAPLLFVLCAGCGGDTTGTSASGRALPAQSPASAAATTATASTGAVPPSTICSDVDAVQQTVAGLRDIPLQKGALPQVQTTADRMQVQVDKLVADAKGNYESQVAPVRAAAVMVQDAVRNARQSPDATTLSAVRSAATDLSFALQNLKASLGSAC